MDRTRARGRIDVSSACSSLLLGDWTGDAGDTCEGFGFFCTITLHCRGENLAQPSVVQLSAMPPPLLHPAVLSNPGHRILKAVWKKLNPLIDGTVWLKSLSLATWPPRNESE